MPLAARLERLPRRIVLGREVPVAAGFRVRLLGLSHLDRAAAGPGLLIPRCSSVHTFGMRFALDLYFLGEDDELIEVRRAVGPCRFAGHRGAAAILEVPTTVPRVPPSALGVPPEPPLGPGPRLFPASSAEPWGDRRGPPGP